MKRLTFVLLFIATSCFADNNLRNYVVKITVLADMGQATGSGVLIKDDLILSANHILFPGANLQLDDGTELFIVKQDVDNDLLLLRKMKKHKGVKFGATPKALDETSAIGYAGGIVLVTFKGNVACLMEDKIFIDSNVMKGMSGGGVFDNKGHLIGIISQQWNEGMSTLLVVIDTHKIREFVKDVQ